MKLDLHTHTKASDGQLSSSELVKKAIEKNIDVIAITDHDTVNGLIELEKEENISNIKIIPGIELSTRWKCSVHILGYFIDIHNEVLLKKLQRKSICRMKEIKQVVKKLKSNLDDSINIKDIIKEENALTMDIIADYLLKKGYSQSRQDSYDKFLIKGKCAFVQKECFEPKEAIEIIIAAGGIPVLAHPNRLNLDIEEKIKLIDKLVQYGLRGIEVYCKNNADLEFYEKICRKYNLLKTGGSDFHKEEDKIGYWNENNLIPSEVYSSLCN